MSSDPTGPTPFWTPFDLYGRRSHHSYDIDHLVEAARDRQRAERPPIWSEPGEAPPAARRGA